MRNLLDFIDRKLAEIIFDNPTWTRLEELDRTVTKAEARVAELEALARKPKDA